MRWCSRQDRTWALILLRAFLLIAGRNDRNIVPFLVCVERLRKVNPRNVAVQLVLAWCVGLVWPWSACRLDLRWGSGRLARCPMP